MLPKNQRIPRNLFPVLRNSPKTFKNKLFLLKVVDNKEFASRVSFSVSKKIAKSAVVRNRLRREGYRSIRQYISKIKSQKLSLFSFLRLPEDKYEIEKEIKSILVNSGLI